MLDRNVFFDKVYAMWMGKNIGGTLGGPLEGRMDLMDIKGYTQSFVEPVENDDLDLQLVNLHCIEQNAGRASSALLRCEWLEHVHFEYDEYGHALTNMRRGILSPLSGAYNNFFTDCMGSPIRSEIWAVICAGMPDLAAFYAYQDASVDHAGGEGIYGEIFFAVLESLAFFETDKFALIDRALSYIPESCDVRGCVELLLKMYHEGAGWVQARQAIIDRYAGDNFTYAPVNIAFTLVGWLYEEGFTKQMLTTINCGYDTDCTVATLGSLLGILYGREYIDSYWIEPLGENIIVSRPITGFDAPKTILELTERSIRARELVKAVYEASAFEETWKIPFESKTEAFRLPVHALERQDLQVSILREGASPAFAPGETRWADFTVTNLQAIPQSLEIVPFLPGFACEKGDMQLAPGESKTLRLSFTAPMEKKSVYRGFIEIKRTLGGVFWSAEMIPFSALPTMDVRIHANGKTKEVQLHENRISKDMLPDGDTDSFTVETVLSIESAGETTFKIACANPVKAYLDEKEIIHCEEKTIVIPAYHRADPRKCASLPAGAGMWKLRIEVGNAKEFEELYFMPVSPEFFWAYRIDSIFA